MHIILLLTVLLASLSTGQRIITVELGSSRYFISKASPYSPQLNWFLAYQYCRTIGMELLTLERLEEVDILRNHFEHNRLGNSEYWTSGNQLGSAMWIWMSTGQPFNTTFNFWPAAGPPLTKTQQSCMSTQGQTWIPQNCMDEKAFICEQTRCFYYNYVTSNRPSSQQGNTTVMPGVTRLGNRPTSPSPSLRQTPIASQRPQLQGIQPIRGSTEGVQQQPHPVGQAAASPPPNLKTMPSTNPELKIMTTAQTLKSMPPNSPVKMMPTITPNPQPHNNEIFPVSPLQILRLPQHEFSHSQPAPLPQAQTQSQEQAHSQAQVQTTPQPPTTTTTVRGQLSRKETFSWALLDGEYK